MITYLHKTVVLVFDYLHLVFHNKSSNNNQTPICSIIYKYELPVNCIYISTAILTCLHARRHHLR